MYITGVNVNLKTAVKTLSVQMVFNNESFVNLLVYQALVVTHTTVLMVR